MKHLALAALLLAAGCAPYQQMRQTYLPTADATTAPEKALNECRFLVAQDPYAMDSFALKAGVPISNPDGSLSALSEHGFAQMKRCMRMKGYVPGPLVPDRG